MLPEGAEANPDRTGWRMAADRDEVVEGEEGGEVVEVAVGETVILLTLPLHAY